MTIPHIDPKIFEKFYVKLAYLFGSRAKGNAGAGSDYDIAVLFGKEPADSLAMKETTFLSLKLKKYFPERLEIISLNAAPLLLQYEVVANGRPLYCKDEAQRSQFEVLVIKKYIDEQPIRDLYNQALHKRILQRS